MRRVYGGAIKSNLGFHSPVILPPALNPLLSPPRLIHKSSSSHEEEEEEEEEEEQRLHRWDPNMSWIFSSSRVDPTTDQSPDYLPGLSAGFGSKAARRRGVDRPSGIL